jgi:DNA-directed RNA polymerase I subunit RPA43
MKCGTFPCQEVLQNFSRSSSCYAISNTTKLYTNNSSSVLVPEFTAMSTAIPSPLHPAVQFKKDKSKKHKSKHEDKADRKDKSKGKAEVKDKSKEKAERKDRSKAKSETKDKSKARSEKKDKDEKKASKKRRHEELSRDIEPHNGAQDHAVRLPESSPPKRLRTASSVPQSSDILVPDSQLPPLDDLESPFLCTTASFRVPIPPIAQSYPLEGVCANYLSPLLLTYDAKLKGIVLGYNNAKLSSSLPQFTKKPKRSKQNEGDDDDDNDLVPLSHAFNEYAAPFIWVTAQFLVLRLRKGITLEANVNLQNESHIGLILWNVFSVTVEKKRLPSTWKWIETTDGDTADVSADADPEDQPMKRQSEVWGTWKNEKGDTVKGLLRFRVRDFDVTLPNKDGEQSILSIEGTLVSEEEEKRLDKEEEEEAAAREKERISSGGSRGSSRAGTPRAGTPRLSSAIGAVASASASRR